MLSEHPTVCIAAAQRRSSFHSRVHLLFLAYITDRCHLVVPFMPTYQYMHAYWWGFLSLLVSEGTPFNKPTYLSMHASWWCLSSLLINTCMPPVGAFQVCLSTHACLLVVPFKPTLLGDACCLLACDLADTAREATAFGMLLYFWGLGNRGLRRNPSLCCMLSMILQVVHQ